MNLPNATQWKGLDVLPCTYNINCRFEARIGLASSVPMRYTDEGVQMTHLDSDGLLDKECLDLIWRITGSTEESQFAFKQVGEHANAIIATMNANLHHYATRMLTSNHPLHRPGKLGTPGTPRYFLMRVYLNHEFECNEHPEMFLGAPLGMYRCPICMHMQVAGLPHISEKMVDEYRASEV